VRLPLPVAIALWAAGCGAPAASAPDLSPPSPPSLAFVDPIDFAPIADGASAQIIHGPQGGYHVLVTLLARGIWGGTPGVAGAADDPTTTLHAFAADGSEVTLTTDGTSVLHQAYQPGGGALVLPDRQLRLDTHTPAAFGGQTFRLAAQVVDRDGHSASTERHVVMLAPVN
jgi:hypothetical protein